MNTQKAIDILERSKEKAAIVCLYTSPYSNKFAAGFVEYTSENYVVLRSLSVHGRYDGWLLREIDALCRIDHGGRYEEKLLSLYQARKESHPSVLMPELDADADLRREILLAAQSGDFAVSIDTGSEYDTNGFVKAVDSDSVVLEKFSEHGQPDGESIIELERIEKINVDDADLQDLKLLARWHEMEPPPW